MKLKLKKFLFGFLAALSAFAIFTSLCAIVAALAGAIPWWGALIAVLAICVCAGLGAM